MPTKDTPLSLKEALLSKTLKDAMLAKATAFETPVEAPKVEPKDTEDGKLLSALKSLLENFGGSKKEAEVEVVKAVNEEQRMVMVVTLQPEVADAHGDIYSAEEIEKACINFNLNCNRVNLLHKAHTSAVKIVQSYIIPMDMPLDDGRTILKGSWVQWLWVDESTEGEVIWKAVKAGELIGISIGCMAETEDVNDDE